MMNRNSRNAGFTLVELMVVIGLIGLLLVFTIPTFQSATRGGNLRTAVFQLNSTLSLARQTAITSRQNVHVIFPDDAPALYSGGNSEHVDKAFRAYAVFGSRDGYIGEWRRLPTGVVIDPDTDVPGPTFNMFTDGDGNTFLSSIANHELRFPDNDGDIVEIYHIGFRPDGTLLTGTIPPTVYLAEGWTEYDTIAGTFSDLIIHLDIPRRLISVNGITGQTMIREFDPSTP